MIRATAAYDLEVIEGVIVTPGKFEGEPEYAPYYYDLAMENGEDELVFDSDDTPVSIFYVSDEDREMFHIKPETHAILLWVSDDGFVNTQEMTETEVSAFIDECMGFQDGEDEDDDFLTEEEE